jgi:hypothetical protein
MSGTNECQGARVLVVEDDAFIAFDLADHLRLVPRIINR